MGPRSTIATCGIVTKCVCLPWLGYRLVHKCSIFFSSLCRLGAVFQHSYARGSGAGGLYCARAALRLWRADVNGDVLQTLLFKVSNFNIYVLKQNL